MPLSMSSSNKRIKGTPIDRLSVLPDSILVHILSLLFSVEAALRTSVLSKRWRFLWAELPNLQFFESGYKHDIEKTNNFVSLINRALDIRKWNQLEFFTVSFMYHECFDSDVDGWIDFCVKNEVKHLGLMMLPYCCDDFYTPPQILYSNSSLTSLHLSRCFMTSERKIEWKSLTKLSLEDVELNELLIDEIVTSSPLLHYLMLERCCGFNRLEVNSRCINCLEIEQSSYEPYLEISAPYIHDLDITVHLQESKCQLKNISSVVKASIDFSEYAYNCSVEMMSNAKEFLENFKHVKELRVWHQAFEILSTMAVNDWQLPQSMLQKLELTSCSEFKHAISGIIGMLESSPNLETLLLDGYEQEGETVNLDPAAKSDLDCDLVHLKTIKVNNLADSNGEPLLTLARTLLRRTPALEEMMIVIDVEDKSDFVNIAQTLLSYPRSSTRAEIHLFSRK